MVANNITTPTEADVVPLWLNGKPLTSPDLEKFPVRSAGQNGKIVHYAQASNVATALQACDFAGVAFQSWKHTPAVERRDIFTKAADVILSRREELVKAQMEETSASRFWADLNVTVAASHVREIAARITSMSGVVPQTKMDYAFAFREPLGATLAIPPWNAALILGARAIVTPLAAGCTVVLKASELSPKSHHLLVQALFDAGLPKDVINIVQVNRDNAAAVTEALISHKAIRKVEFIGSANVGRIIGSVAGGHLKPVLMELGGKCAAIVLEDADLEDAALKCIVAAFNHHGQVCFSTERIYVVKEVAERFISLLKDEAKKFPAGGAVSQRGAQASVAKLVDAERKGAKFLLGGAGFQDESSSALQPTIITNVTEDMEIFDEESFGPSVAVHIVEDQEEALKLVNDSAYGLVGAVHTKDMNRGLQIARRMEVGIAHVNGATAFDESTLPLGGAKNSGWGRTNGGWGLEEFSELKLVTVSTKPGLPNW
jgi:acyl-CoA reductase-like NAD-dependent aldehyde dehydrogenase